MEGRVVLVTGASRGIGAATVRRLVRTGHRVRARRLLDGNLATPVVDDLEVPMTDTTVVVPVGDRVEQLEHCLAAPVPLRVMVVDDVSEDWRSVARVARRHDASPSAARHQPPSLANAGLRAISVRKPSTHEIGEKRDF